MGARAHCDRHGAGQRPNVLALVRWQSQAGLPPEGRRAASEAPGPWPHGRAAAPPPEQLQTQPDASGVVGLAPHALRWQAAGADAAAHALGSLCLWAPVPVATQWVELTLSVHHAGRWVLLQPERVDDGSAAGGAPAADLEADLRSSLWLRPQDVQALHALGPGLADLRAAAADPAGVVWVGREDGLGFFLAGLIDLGWPTP
jgi:hypothetical protein